MFKLTKKNVVVLLMLLSSLLTIAQRDIKIKKKEFADQTKFLQTKDILHQANNYFSSTPQDFDKALVRYLKLLEIPRLKRDPELNLRIGVSYLYSREYVRETSLEYILKYTSLNGVTSDMVYHLARSYHINLHFDSAIKYYKQALKNDVKYSEDHIKRRIEACITGKELVRNPILLFIDNLGDAINTSTGEYAPSISSDESKMIFTVKENEIENIYQSFRRDGKWTPRESAGSILNTSTGIANVGLSVDGQEMFVFLPHNGGDLYSTRLVGNEWQKPTSQKTKKLNSPFHEAEVSVSYDGKTLYFVSDNKRTSLGGHDIYSSTWDPKKERWGTPENLGPNINTPYEERSVFIHPDNKTLYFSSSGHNTMGGLDVMYSVRKSDGTWSLPVNIGYPLNTPNHDFSFVIGAHKKRGYYSTVRAEGKGHIDIYAITFRGQVKDPMLIGENQLLMGNIVEQTVEHFEESVAVELADITVIKGTVKNYLDQPLSASIEIWDNITGEILIVSHSNSATGEFLSTLPSGKNYGISISAPGFVSFSENIDIKDSKGYQSLLYNVQLQSVEAGASVVLKNIFFATDKSDLRSESKVELDKLAKFMKEYKSLKVEISGHTDNVGSDDYNMDLSKRRAQSVSKALISRGVNEEQLVSKGYGESTPVADNSTEKGKQENRRVEFKILSIE